MSAPSAIGMPSEPDTNGPSEKAVAEFAKLASDERIRAAAAALERNGISCVLVDSGDEARTAVRSMLPIGAEVFNNTSRTLEVIGVAEDVERSGHYQPPRPRLYQMDREMQGREMRQLAAEIGLRPKVTVYRLEQANEALLALKNDAIDGAAVLVP